MGGDRGAFQYAVPLSTPYPTASTPWSNPVPQVPAKTPCLQVTYKNMSAMLRSHMESSHGGGGRDEVGLVELKAGLVRLDGDGDGLPVQPAGISASCFVVCVADGGFS